VLAAQLAQEVLEEQVPTVEPLEEAVVLLGEVARPLAQTKSEIRERTGHHQARKAQPQAAVVVAEASDSG